MLPTFSEQPAHITAAESDEDDWAEDVTDDDSSGGEVAAGVDDQQVRGPMRKRARGAT